MIKKLKNNLARLIFAGVTILSSQESIVANEVPNKIPPGIPAELFDNTPLAPTQVFDNIYVFGTKSVVVWALKTTDGIILIDSMWNANDGKNIMADMEKSGLNPQDIKYILITHGHGDHYGGAQYIKNHTNAKIAMSKVDYDYMMKTNSGANGPNSPKPVVDFFIKNEDIIKLGDTSITVVETPGHTPGCLSFIYPAIQDGKIYTAAIWGGTGAPAELQEKLTYKKSIDYFEKYTNKANVTIATSTHLFTENGYAKLDAAKNRKKGEPNPFYLGEIGFDNYLDDLRLTMDKAIEDQKLKK